MLIACRRRVPRALHKNLRRNREVISLGVPATDCPIFFVYLPMTQVDWWMSGGGSVNVRSDDLFVTRRLPENYRLRAAARSYP
jgi:hypothetical protein